jgi:hypothetical protein
MEAEAALRESEERLRRQAAELEKINRSTPSNWRGRLPPWYDGQVRFAADIIKLPDDKHPDQPDRHFKDHDKNHDLKQQQDFIGHLNPS